MVLVQTEYSKLRIIEYYSLNNILFVVAARTKFSSSGQREYDSDQRVVHVARQLADIPSSKK